MSHRSEDANPEQTGGLIAGVAFVIAGAVLLSFKGIVAKLMYAQGGDPVTVAAVRSVLAVPGFWAWALFRVGPKRLFAVPPTTLLPVAGVGLLSYYAGAMINFYALTMIDAALERMLLFTYPLLVVTALAIIERRWPRLRVLVAMVVTYGGVVLAVGGLDASLLRANALGASLTLLSAAGVAAYYLVNANVSQRIGSQTFTVYAMTAAGIGMGLHLLVTRELGDLAALPGEFWSLMMFMVLAVTVLPLFLMGVGIARVGAARGSLISAIGPASTVFAAYLLLGERLTLGQVVGSALIVAGILLLESRAAVKHEGVPSAR
ncbi:MAG: DMT family transporter [Pseudomonadota bacterium]